MGNGTNLIVRDRGIRGVVVKILDGLNRYEVKDDIIIAETGILMSKLARIALEYGLAGLEFAEGIPGTLGGAVAMNAGAYTGEMSDIVIKTEYIDKGGNLLVLDREGHRFGKRTSFIQTDGGIALRVHMKLNRGDREKIKALMDDFNRQRREKQPLELPSAGSIFKRPEGYFAGKLIQDCGLKGCRTGGAEVSSKHSGFIVITADATAEDIVKLINHIQAEVKSKFQVELQTEVRIVGEE
jgi:UDP-N-acetylmuramate dehydrogenase